MPTEDFGIDSLAAYLHLTPQQVARLADRGKLPGRRIGGHWRFTRAEIHLWLEQRIGVSDEGQLIEVEGVLERSRTGDETGQISIARMLPLEALAIPLASRTANAVFRDMVELAARTGFLWDPEKMTEAVRSREALHPTALENGVALLHPRRPMPSILGQAFLALGCIRSGIPFGGGRGNLTDIFFLILSVDDRGHLRTLARLSRILGQAGFLDDLRAAADPASARRLIASAEEELNF